MRHLPDEVLISHARACMDAIRDHAAAMTRPGTPMRRLIDAPSPVPSIAERTPARTGASAGPPAS